MYFLSPKAKLEGVHIGPGALILGPSSIGAGTLIDAFVVVGYLTRSSLMSLRSLNINATKLLEEGDKLSRGAKIGRNCLIRTGSVIYEGCEIDDEVEVGHNVLIRENTITGRSTVIGSGTIIEGQCRIGRNVSIQSNAFLPLLTVIEDDVFIGPRAVITNDKYPKSRRIVPTVVKRRAILGANATIIAGVTVGEEAVVAAGAVVTKDVKPGKVVAGVPAKEVGDVADYKAKKKAYEGVKGD
ncbi:MAG: DapH/DapD/GlmU-related protein [Candidatus Nezhaarchaeales archaeon]